MEWADGSQPVRQTVGCGKWAEDATGFSDRSVHLTVGEPVSLYPHKANIQILASADTSYGIDSVATMVSDLQTAPDQLATFQIAFDVTPQAGQQIVSGSLTDATTSQSWGINDPIFNGNDHDSVESISNIRVVNFNANGGNLIVHNIKELAFEYALIADGQSSGDRILVDVDGVLNKDGGISLVSNPDTISLKVMGYVAVTDAILGTGNDGTTNKWSVNSINVSYVIQNADVE